MPRRAAACGLALLLLAGGALGQEEPAAGPREAAPVASPYQLLRIHLPTSAAGLRVAVSQGSAVANLGNREAVQLGSVFQVFDQSFFVGLVRVEQVWADSARVRLISLDRKLDPGVPYPLEPGCSLVPKLVLLETVHFDSTGLDLSLDVQERLRAAVRFIRAFPTFPVVLEVHADPGEKKAEKKVERRGKKAAAAVPRLSLVQGEKLRTYLHEVHRIPLEQMQVRDMGDRRPLASSATAADRRQNRRIEIVVRDQVEAVPDTLPKLQEAGPLKRSGR